MSKFIGFIKRDKVPLMIALGAGLLWAVVLFKFDKVNFGVEGLAFLICIPAIYAFVSLIVDIIQELSKPDKEE